MKDTLHKDIENLGKQINIMKDIINQILEHILITIIEKINKILTK